jgi:microsomal dipeptidase-like Zn-dependent dipeptidase
MRRGYTSEDIKQVVGLNLLRVFREVEKVSAQLKRDKL